MTTRARTNSLKPKALVTTKASRPNSKSPFYEPRHNSHATKHDHWNKAMQAEYLALINGTWSLVSPPPNTNIIGCKWVYKVKLKADGSIERYKARLLAKGFNQEEGVDYFDTFSPVVRPTTIRLVLTIALSQKWSLRQVDINNAFLHGSLNDIVYMEQPEGFVDSTRTNHVCKLHKALYGLKQAPRAWFTKLKLFLLQHGFRSCHSDSCLFVYHSHNITAYILVYVDDLIITGILMIISPPSFVNLIKPFLLKTWVTYISSSELKSDDTIILFIYTAKIYW